MEVRSLTPLVKQYLEIKSQYPDAILFFRIGDFYEMFFEDAHIGSRELDIVLTSRDKGHKERVPLCGVPFHAADSYINKLLQKGYKVAICEQVEDPKLAKGIVRREVVRVLTPALVTEIANLGERENRYLMGFCVSGEVFGIAFLELSTAECKGTEIVGFEAFVNEALRNEPREIVALKSFQRHPLIDRFKKSFEGLTVNFLEDEKFDVERAWENISARFPGRYLEERRKHPLASVAIWMVLSYAEQNQKRDLSHIGNVEFYELQDYMILDETTRRNLELTESIFDRGKKGSLFWVMDETVTAMGSRRLKQWLLYPLLNVYKIEERLDGVSELYEKKIERKELREILREIHDLERLSSRIFLGHANARDLLALKRSLSRVARIKEILKPFEARIVQECFCRIETFDDLVELLDLSIAEDPPATVKEGGIIKSGFNKELDSLREIAREGKGWMLKLEAEERRKTGIASLKIRYNQVFGYYIEVTKSNLHLVPEYYERKQTLVNAERFVTPELKEFEQKILGAEESICQLEYRIFEQIREKLAEATHRLQRTASAIATLDSLASLAEIADKYNYVKPILDESDEVIIHDGRHPVLERMDLDERFVPNDTVLNTRDHQILIITGPNMAGKSTYLRQVALIILMAQMGSFVPARDAKIGVVDRIFTRIGASDNIARGQSTFMVEMMETAKILNQATERSFVVLDEIGRGTSTFDGLSIAWAVAEYLHDHPIFRPRTLFATHYHELTELSLTKDRIKNFNVAVREWNGEIIFLRKIVEGETNRSYGIQVARLAGLPQAVIERAKEILSNLEMSELDPTGMPRLATSKRRRGGANKPAQLPLFDSLDPLRAELRKIRIEKITPLEALNILDELKRKAEEGIK